MEEEMYYSYLHARSKKREDWGIKHIASVSQFMLSNDLGPAGLLPKLMFHKNHANLLLTFLCFPQSHSVSDVHIGDSWATCRIPFTFSTHLAAIKVIFLCP